MPEGGHAKSASNENARPHTEFFQHSVDVGKACTADEAWSKGRRWYGAVLITTFVAVGAAFVPATFVWLRDGTWHMNVIYPFTNPFQNLVSAHAISALLMLGLFIVQAATGVFAGEAASTRRIYHRAVGKWVLTPLLFVSLGLASAAEVAANLCCQEPSFETILISIVIFTTFTLGLRAARQKRYAAHKDWMMWTVLLTCQVGLARIGMYIVQPFYRCDTFKSDWPFVFSVWLSNLAAFVCLRSVGRFGWQYKANLFLWLMQAVIGVYMVVSAVEFQCPSEVMQLATIENATAP